MNRMVLCMCLRQSRHLITGEQYVLFLTVPQDSSVGLVFFVHIKDKVITEVFTNCKYCVTRKDTDRSLGLDFSMNFISLEKHKTKRKYPKLQT